MLRNIFIQLIVFFVIFNLVSMMRETDMLSTSDDIVPAQHQLKTISNKDINLYAKGKKNIVYFFAPWCQVCNLSIDNLQTLHKNMPEVNIVAVALDYVDIEQVKQFTDHHQLTFPIALGNEAVKNDYKVMGYPSYYVLNEENTVIERSLGYSSQIGLYLRSF